MQCIMENIKTCELCLEQIIKTEDFENLNYVEKQYLTILKNLDISVSRDAKICSNCVNVSHLLYNFKTSCLANNDHLKTLIYPGINDKLILEEVIVKKTKSEFKNEEKVCRFCLNFSEVNLLVEVNLEQDVVLKDMLEMCLPEIDTNIVQNLLMCYTCSELLEKLYNFISQYKDTVVVRNLDTKTDVLVNENTSSLTVENNDENINESFVKEENCDGIEEPELQIKSENFDIDEDIKGSINESTCLLKEGEIKPAPSSFPSSFTYHQTHWKTRKSTISKLYKCTECCFQTKHRTSLARHKKNIENAKCTLCGCRARTTCEMEKHKKESHNDRKQGSGSKMPGTTCAVVDCNNSYGEAKKRKLPISFHSFPTAKELRDNWKIACKRGDSWNPRTSYICGAHFKGEDFENDLQYRLMNIPVKKRLKKTAVPTIFPTRRECKSETQDADNIQCQESPVKFDNKKFVEELLVQSENVILVKLEEEETFEEKYKELLKENEMLKQKFQESKDTI